MTYMILDSTGSAINAYDDLVAARARLRAIVADDPDSADHLFLLTYDEAGNVVGDAVTFAELPDQTAEMVETAFLLAAHTTAWCVSVGALVASPARPAADGQRRNLAAGAAA